MALEHVFREGRIADTLVDMERASLAIQQTLENEIAAERAKVRQLEIENARLKGVISLRDIIAAGVHAQASAMRKALAQVSPGNSLLRETGLKYKDGRKQTALGALFDRAHDQKAKELGLPYSGHKYRDVAS